MVDTLSISATVKPLQFLSQEEYLEAIFNSLSDGILVLNSKLKITHANKAAEQITGYSAFSHSVNSKISLPSPSP